LSAIENVLGLIYVSDNTLATSAPVAITFSYNEGYANTLIPSTKKYQFVVSEENIIITAIVLTPASSAVVPSVGVIDFDAFGGYGSYVYTLAVNNSGGTINASTGVYTAGSTPSVQDTIRVTDAMGNTATALVQVI